MSLADANASMAGDTSMKASLQSGVRQIDLVRLETPRATPGTVVVKVAATGICGSDLHFYRARSEPQITPMGHETTGVLHELGESVANLFLGQRVVIDMVAGTACGVCSYCRMGYAIHCTGERVPFGGGLAEFVRTKAAGIFPLPDAVDDALGTLVEPLAVGVHAVRRMRVEPGMVGVIVGAGTIGLTALAAAISAGSEKVYVVAKHPFQAEAALALGASGILPPDPSDMVAALAAANGGSGADYAIETVGGTGDTLDLAARLVRPLGMVGVLGAFRDDFRPLTLIPPHIKEITFHLPNCYSVIDGKHDFQVAIELLAQKSFGAKLARLITHQLSLDEVAAAFRIADDKSSRSIKVLVLP